jgi:hypothetical protein
METELDIKETIATGYINAKENQALFEYAILIPLIFVVAVFGVKLYVGATKYYASEEEQLIFLVLFLLSFGLSIYSIFKIRFNKKLSLIKTNMTKLKNKEIIDKIGKDFGWNIVRSNQNYFIANTPSKMIVGQEVTAILKEKELLVNVRLTMGMRGRFPFSLGRNRRLLKQIETQIQNHLTTAKTH